MEKMNFRDFEIPPAPEPSKAFCSESDAPIVKADITLDHDTGDYFADITRADGIHEITGTITGFLKKGGGGPFPEPTDTSD